MCLSSAWAQKKLCTINPQCCKNRKVGGHWSVVKQKMEKSRQARRNVGDKVGKGGSDDINSHSSLAATLPSMVSTSTRFPSDYTNQEILRNGIFTSEYLDAHTWHGNQLSYYYIKKQDETDGRMREMWQNLLDSKHLKGRSREPVSLSVSPSHTFDSKGKTTLFGPDVKW